ncbi:MAG: hypothetical protein L0287_06865 [Anaerolineae bacterium]|nr:hypothetical protein [Anaerolineae bacterium]MCI0608544.1 hypothetical protein [Anaerolineae bacterium]
MKIIKNEQRIKRNAKIGSWTSLAAMAVLGLGMYISFTRTELIAFSLTALIIGFTLTQVGMYMGNKYGRSPRPDEKLDAGLKGLPNEFVMYHYTTPVSHLLVGPAGVWVILPYHQRGQVTFKKNRWRISGGGFMQGYMRIFGQEGLGRPDYEVEGEVNALRKYLNKHMDESEIPEINALMVFTHENVEIEVEDSPVPVLKLKQIKEFIRQKAKEKRLPAERINQLKSLLE